MKLQDFQSNYTTRVKFAITADDDLSHYVTADNRYTSLWSSLPEGWVPIQEGSVVPAPNSHPHTAKLLSTPSGDVLGVEHETGLEIVALGAALVSAAASVIALYQTWRSNRRGQDSNDSLPSRKPRSRSGSSTTRVPVVGTDALVVETREKGSDGVIRMTTTTVPAHLVTTELLADLIGPHIER